MSLTTLIIFFLSVYIVQKCQELDFKDKKFEMLQKQMKETEELW